jgi:hypothetical protein
MPTNPANIQNAPGKATPLSEARPYATVSRAGPALTRSTGIKLNNRLSLRAPTEKITSPHRIFPGPSVAKPSVDDFPAGGFFEPGDRFHD